MLGRVCDWVLVHLRVVHLLCHPIRSYAYSTLICIHAPVTPVLHAHICKCKKKPTTTPCRARAVFGMMEGMGSWVFNALVAIEVNGLLELVRLPLVLATTPKLAEMLKK